MLYIFKKHSFLPHRLSQTSIENIISVKDDCCNFRDSLFCREKKTFEWIFKYPWLGEFRQTTSFYPFSWFTHSFFYKWISIDTGKPAAPSYLIFIREGFAKLLYWKATSLNDHLLIAKSVANFCLENDIKTLTVIDPIVSKHIRKVRNPFVFSKKYKMNIYSTFDIDYKNMNVYDGDGDTIFT
jgi:hypothetical protein